MRRLYYFKIFFSFVISFILTSFFTKIIFLGNTPQISGNFISTVKNPRYVFDRIFKGMSYIIAFNKTPAISESKTVNKIVFNTGPQPPPSLMLFPTKLNLPTPTSFIIDQPKITDVINNIYLSPTVAPSIPSSPTPTRSIPQNPPTKTPTPINQSPTGIPTLNLADFGRCLTNRGMKEYVQPGCSACSYQKQILGEAAKYVTTVSCPDKPAECSAVGVRSTPSWSKDGKLVIPGVASLEMLSEVSGCQLPK